jgi:hypothetical protein
MNLKYLLLFLLLMFQFNIIFSQKESKFGLIFLNQTKSDEILKENEETQFMKFIQVLDEKTSNGKAVYVSHQSTLSNVKILTFDNGKNSIPDTINGNFKVIKIISKNNNYTIVNNKIKKIKIYLIFLEAIDETQGICNIKNICVISQKNNRHFIKKKINVGKLMNIQLISLFKTNFYIKPENIESFIKLSCESNLYFEKIWLVNADCGNNYFFSPTIESLYKN